jgi:hypothetical protein
MNTARDKLNALMSGETVITSDEELDAMLELGDDAIYAVRTLPNPARAGLLDQYRAWIDQERKTRLETIG